MTALIPIYGRGGVVAQAQVDDEDAERVSAFRWNLDTKGYARGARYLGGGRSAARYLRTSMHRLILGLEPGDPRQGDHRNGDVLDNRRSNLRVATGAQNSQNRTRTHGASQYRGVHFNRRYKARPWEATVRHDGQRHYLGRYATEEEAAEVAAAKRAELMPFSEEVASSLR